MKVSSVIIPLILGGLGINAATLPAEPANDFFEVKNTDVGPVYSNKPAHRRRDSPDAYYPVGGDDHATVYSNIQPPANRKRDGAPGALEPVSPAAANEYLEAQYVVTDLLLPDKRRRLCQRR